MANSIRSIPLERLDAHPDNPNEQSRVNFAKLVRNIERTGRYEPLIVRPSPEKAGCFQIINGHHRWGALKKLGYESAECIVWDIDDEQTDILLATLNRLSGSDNLGKKLKLLKRLNERFRSGELAKLLPLKKKQIERLTNLKMPNRPAKINAKHFLSSLVFFVRDAQQRQIENALSLVEEPKSEMTNAAKRAAALNHIAGYFLNHSKINAEIQKSDGQKKAIE